MASVTTIILILLLITGVVIWYLYSQQQSVSTGTGTGTRTSTRTGTTAVSTATGTAIIATSTSTTSIATGTGTATGTSTSTTATGTATATSTGTSSTSTSTGTATSVYPRYFQGVGRDYWCIKLLDSELNCVINYWTGEWHGGPINRQFNATTRTITGLTDDYCTFVLTLSSATPLRSTRNQDRLCVPGQHQLLSLWPVYHSTLWILWRQLYQLCTSGLIS